MLPSVDTTKHSASFTGQNGASYSISVRARDRVGNVSQWVSADPVTVQTETKYYLFGGRRVAMSQGSAVYYFHTNHLGSVVLTTDAAGAALSQTRYLPFGEEHWSSGGNLSDFMYTGQRNDSYINSICLRSRYYSETGRFLTKDTWQGILTLSMSLSFTYFFLIKEEALWKSSQTAELRSCLLEILYNNDEQEIR